MTATQELSDKKAKRAEYKRAYYVANKEKIKSRSQTWRATNRSAHIAYTKQWRIDNPERAKLLSTDGHYKRSYGLITSQVDSMFKDQGECCAICQTDSPGNSQWCVDHDHTSSNVRSILCAHCNWMLGHAKDNPTILLAGAQYLERHSI